MKTFWTQLFSSKWVNSQKFSRPSLFSKLSYIHRNRLHLFLYWGQRHWYVPSHREANNSALMNFHLLLPQKKHLFLRSKYSNSPDYILPTQAHGSIEVSLPLEPDFPELLSLSKQANEGVYFDIFSSCDRGFWNVNMGALHTGNFLTRQISHIFFSDLDKTLIDTQFKNPKDILLVLNRKSEEFPLLSHGWNLFKEALENKQAIGWILSASPMIFYPSIFRWLELHQLPTHRIGILLKDYQRFLPTKFHDLSTGDMTSQSIYKLRQHIHVLKKMGLPMKMTLMGDPYESDPWVFLALISILHNPLRVQETYHFLLKISQLTVQQAKSSSQRARLLESLFEFSNLVRMHQKDRLSCFVKVYIQGHFSTKSFNAFKHPSLANFYQLYRKLQDEGHWVTLSVDKLDDAR